VFAFATLLATALLGFSRDRLPVTCLFCWRRSPFFSPLIIHHRLSTPLSIITTSPQQLVFETFSSSSSSFSFIG
jgi:hypothetical protein